MRFLLAFFPIIFIFGIIYYIFSDLKNSNWKVRTSLQSPDKNIVAKIKCLDEGGATVGFYCKLYFENKNKTELEMMMIRIDDIDIKWISSDVLEASVADKSKIYDFTSVYWDDNQKVEYFVKLKYK